MVKGILAIKPNADFEFFKINYDNISNLNISGFPNEIKTMFGKGGISRECDFKCGNYDISVFAFSDGLAGKENKFDLPPPIDQSLYFGCLIIIAHVDNAILTLTTEMFDKFYERVFEGFVNLGEEDTWSDTDEENSDDRDFIVDDDHIEYETGASEEEEEEEYIDDEDDDAVYIGSDESEETSSEATSEISSKSADESSQSDTNNIDSVNVKLKITIGD